MTLRDVGCVHCELPPNFQVMVVVLVLLLRNFRCSGFEQCGLVDERLDDDENYA